MHREAVISFLIVSAFALHAHAQCAPHWLSETPTQPINSSPVALVRHPGGDVFAGGQFSQAGGVSTNCIARWDGAAWSAVDTAFTPGSVTPRVHALAVMPDGDLVAAGHFASAGGVTANHIARWDGSTWSALAGGLSGASFGNTTQIFSLLPLANGDLIVGGEFTMAGATPAMRIARWDGTTWHAMGPGFGSTGSFSPVYSLIQLPSGEIVAGGQFTFSGATGVARIAMWNGSAWTPLSTGMSNGGSAAVVRALALAPDGTLIAGGRFATAGGVAAKSLARWDGSAWSGIGGGVGTAVQHEAFALAISLTGEITVGGSFSSAAGSPVSAIARWDGATWSDFAGGVSTGTATAPSVTSLLLLPGGELLVGGTFLFAGGTPATRFARWTDTGSPILMHNPAPAELTCNSSASFTASAAAGYGPVLPHWQLEDPADSGVWSEIFDGPVMIQGMHAATAANSQTFDLSLTPISSFNPIRLRAAATNSCGTATSTAILLQSNCPPLCDPDVNCDGSINGFDIEATEQAINGDYTNFCQPSADLNNDGAENGFDIETEEQRVNGAPC